MPMSQLAHSLRAKLIYWTARLLNRLTGGRGSLDVYLICVQPLQSVKAPRSSGLTDVAKIEPDADIVARFPRAPLVNQRRFEAGYDCYAATVKGDFAGHIWIATERYDEDAFRCSYRLPADRRSVWDFDVYVEPRFRLGRTGALLWSEVSRELSRQGFEQTYSRISLLNPVSIQVHERLGAKRIGSCAFLALGRFQLMASTLPPYLHFGFSDKKPPTLRLPERAHPLKGRPVAAALVLGADSHGLATIRALARCGIPTYVADHATDQPGLSSRYLAGRYTLPHFNTPDFPAALAKLRKQLNMYSEVVLLAINDRQVEQIARHVELLAPLYKIAWLPQAATVLELLRKDALEARARAQGLNYPKSLVIRKPGDASVIESQFEFPVILKPVRPLSAFKTEIAQSYADLRLLLDKHQSSLPILAQEYIAGGDESIFFGALTLHEGQIIQSMVGRKIASHPPARGQTLVAQTHDEPEVVHLAARFFDGLGLSGVASLELKRDRLGRFWVIEPTLGRSDFWVELCIGAGYNQPLHEYLLAVDQPPSLRSEPATLRASVWYDTERAPLAYVQHRLGLLGTRRPAGMRTLFPYLGQNDWHPWMLATAHMLRTRLARWLGRRRTRGA